MGAGRARGRDLVIPNPKLKLLDQVREVLRLRHYSRLLYGSGLRLL
jgi:hypothetical protein